MIRVLHGDCRELLRELEDNSIDSVVCDPPYELGFMNRKWDSTGIANCVELWAEVLRVLKPGAHLFAFGGTRTYHRMACAIEDAGFEIRDQLSWIFGSGFPKSLDVSKAIDKAAGAERDVIGRKLGRAATPVQDINGGSYAGGNGINSGADCSAVTAPATDAARQWDGWGTALKPSFEPICLARKSLSEPTVAANVLRWGTGAINVGACRVPTNGEDLGDPTRFNGQDTKVHDGWMRPCRNNDALMAARHAEAFERAQNVGRFPANLVHDGSEEVLACFPETKSGSRNGEYANGTFSSGAVTKELVGGSGSAARFFYCAKANASDRCGSKHPTIKPISLLQWLCRLITPPGGTVLDLFAGSGTTGEAAYREGFGAILIEREDEYVEDIKRRLRLMKEGPVARKHATAKARGEIGDAGPLFGGGEVPRQPRKRGERVNPDGSIWSIDMAPIDSKTLAELARISIDLDSDIKVTVSKPDEAAE